MLRRHRSRPAALIALLSLVCQLLPAMPARAQAAAVTLTPTPTPVAGQPGVHYINLFGSGFPAGVIAPAAVQVALAPQPPATGPSAQTTATSVTTLGGSSRRVTFQIPTTLTVAAPTAYRVTLSGTTTGGTPFQSSNASVLDVMPPPSVSSVAPASAFQDTTVLVTISAQYTNFVQGTTTASFGAGVRVGGAAAGAFGPVTVVSPTRVQAEVAVVADAVLGPRTIQIRTGTQTASRADAFTVTGPMVTGLEPAHVNIAAAGGVASLTVTVQTPHPTRPMRIALSSGDPAIAFVPAEVVLVAGHTTGQVPVTGGVAGGPVSITATINGTSAAASVTVSERPAPPVLTEPLVEGAAMVSGTGIASALLDVFVDGAPAASTAVDASGQFSAAVATPLMAGQVVTATQTSGGLTSLLSTPVTVRARTPAPTVNAPLIEGATIVAGTGTPTASVAVFVDGVLGATGDVQGDGTFTAVLPALVAGQQVTATQTLGGQTSVPSAAVTVVGVPPSPGLVTSPVEGTTTLAGTGVPGAVVEAFLDGVSAGTAIVGVNGTWTLVLGSPLVAGQLLTTRQTVNGVPSALTPEILVPALPPAPAVNAPLVEGTAIITGTGVPGGVVEVFVDGLLDGTAVAGGGGTWTRTLALPLVAGQQVTARQTVNGVASGLSAEVIVVARPPAPIVSAPLVEGTTTVTGTGISGATLDLFVDGTSAGSTNIAGAGSWTTVLGAALVAGQSVTARQTAGGIESPLSPAVVVVAIPPAPAVNAPIVAGATTVAGTGIPAATLELFADGTSLGTTSVTATGTWALPFATPLVAGQAITARQTVAGIVSDQSAPVMVVATLVEIAIAPAPTATVTAGQGISFTARGTFSDGSVLDPLPGVAWSSSDPAVVTIAADGLAAGQTPGLAAVRAARDGIESPPTTVTVKPVQPSVTAPLIAGTTTVTGTGTAAATLEVFADGASLGTTTVTAPGTWSLALATALTARQAITARQTAAGVTSDPSAAVIVGDALLAQIAIVPAPTATLTVGQTVAFTARGTFSDSTVIDPLPGVTWSSSDPAVITIAADGLATSQTPGVADIRATRDGVQSSPTTVTVKPVRPVVASPLSAGATTVSGTASAGAMVQVFVDGAPRGAPAMADGSGQWTAAGLAPALAVGNSVTARQTANGVESDPSTAVVVTSSTPVLTSINVTPVNLTLAAGATQQYAAVGVFSNASTQDLTSQVSWYSTVPSFASITAGGLVSALDPGPTTIRATLGAIVGSTTLTVTATELVSIVVTPATPIVLTGQTQAFIATGVRSDGTSENLTSSATWSSTNTTAATINSATGLATAAGAGTTSVVATLGAISGSTTLTVNATVTDPTPPTAIITSPATNATITDVVTITGTANDANFLKYVLELAPAGTTSFTTLAEGAAPVVGGALGTLDPTLLINDLYTVRLTAFDRGGNSTSTSAVYQVTRDVKVGAFTLTFQDHVVPLGGLPIVINRVYDSRDVSKGDFGAGWRLDIQTMRLRANGVLGSNWVGTRSGGILPTYCITPGTAQHKVSITLPDGKVEEFDMSTNPSCAQIVPPQFATATFVARPGTRGRLQPVGNDSLFVTGSWPGALTLLDDGTFEAYNPQTFQYTTPEGYVYVINRTAGVQSIRDPNNNTITIGPGGITHSSGRSVAFQRDAAGRITRISGPGAEVFTYAYNNNGDLAQYTDAAASLTRYFYNLSHGLIEIRDPRGVRPVRNEYDDDGRLVASIDAQGNRVEYAHDLAANRETIVDRLGRARLLEYDGAGNVTRETHPDGTTTIRTYDTRGNALTETDAVGGVVTQTYNALDLVLTRRDQLGNLVDTFTYDAMGNVLTHTDGRGNVTTHTYDGRGNRLSTTDGEGHRTQWTYDAAGNVLTVIDPHGAVTTNVYDAFSNLTRTTDPLGNVTTYTYDTSGRKLTETRTRTVGAGSESLVTTFAYDAAGRLTQTTRPDGSTVRNEYDAVGNLTATIDPLGRRTTYEYDALNRRVRTTFPDATTERTQFDAEGQETGRIDRAGRVTTFTYDARGRVKRAIAVDGTIQERVYDAAGRLTGTIDENGFGSTQTFDAAGRVLTQTDAMGRVTVNTYDVVGNKVTSRDPAGRTTSYEYDRRNLLVRTVFPDGTAERYAYDPAQRLTATVDQGGDEIQLAYDLAGRLTRVTDALGSAWGFAYDEVGNRISQTDPLGRVTRFDYDRLRRETRRTLPMGLSQSRQYDSAGNLVRRIDYSGATTTFTYDGQDRLLTRTHPDASSARFTYTATGLRATAQDARGITSYSYDSRDRLTRVVRPDGSSLDYVYDAASNVTGRTATVGATTLPQTFTYDRSNLLAGVTDSRARGYTYSYTPTGKVASLALPNGVTTQYGYSAVDRLTGITARNSVGAALQSFTYALSPAGRRTQVDETGGLVRQFTYDRAGRLITETVNGSGGALFTNAFTYDAVGNRTRVDHTPAGGPVETRLFTYDDRDRLLTDGAVAVTWDADGRLVAKSDGTTNIWDSEGRLLVSVFGDGSMMTHDYDVDGNRVRTTATAAGGVPETTHFLVDAHGPLSHVVVEHTGAGAVKAEYVRGGDQLLAVVRPAGTRFYHADGVGSIRALTDEAGAVTDTYQYDAFGSLTSRTGTDPNPYLFTGEPLTLGGLYQLRARWMDPSTGRFLSLDPKEGVAEQPRTLHRYAYVGNDPVNFTDPTGEFSFSIAGISISINIQGNLRSISTASGQAALNAIRQRIGQLGVHSVRALRGIRVAGQQTHHLIEQRLWNANPALRQLFRHVDDIPGVNLTPAQHQVFTNAWRQLLPYSNQAGHIANPTLQQIMAAAEQVYASHPALLRAVYLALL